MANYRVLIVDDQHDVRRMLRAGLETLKVGVKVADVPSGEEAMLVLSRQPVDVLVSDVRLPGISGLELKEKALVRNPGLKLILITGMTEHRVRRQVEEAGADAYFIKPIDMADFLATVERLLGMSHSPEADAAAEPAQAAPAPAVSAPAAPAPARKLRQTGRLTYRAAGDPKPPVRRPQESPEIKEPRGPEPAVEEPPRRKPAIQEPPQPDKGEDDPGEKQAEKKTQWWRVEKQAPLTLSDRLANLRQDTDSAAVILLDGQGGVLAQTGSLPGLESEPALAGALLNVLRAGCEAAALAGKTARGGASPAGVYYISGQEYDHFLAHIGQGGALWLASPVGAGEAVEKTLCLLRAVAPEITAGLKELGMALDAPPETLPVIVAAATAAEPAAGPAAAPGNALPDLEELFGQAEKQPAPVQDLDAFWDKLVEQEGEAATRRNTLSFDQARELGLDLDEDIS